MEVSPLRNRAVRTAGERTAGERTGPDGYFWVIAPQAAAAVVKRHEIPMPALAARLCPQPLLGDAPVPGVAGSTAVADQTPDDVATMSEATMSGKDRS